MSAATRIIAIAVCAGLAGCTTMAPPASEVANRGARPPHGAKKVKECKTSSGPGCNIGIAVDTTTSPGSPKIVINSDDDWFVSVKKNQATKITWTLQTSPGYRFDLSKGIDFNEPSIICSGTDSNPTKFECTVKHEKNEIWVYKYAIKVVPGTGSTSPAPPVLDPWVVGE